MLVSQSLNKCINTRFVSLRPSRKEKHLFGFEVKSWRNYGNLSYIHKLGSEPLRAITVGNLLEEVTAKYKDKPFLISRHQNKVLTYGQILEEADRLAAVFTALGLRRGDRVGLYLPNRYEWVTVLFACIRADLNLVALNPAYQASELKYCINKVGLSALICKDYFKTQNYYDILNEVCPEIGQSDPGKIKSKSTPSLKHAIIISDKTFRGAYNYEEVLKLSNQNDINNIKSSQHLIDPENSSVIQFTSGTTGLPKATISTHFNMVNNSYHIAKRLEMDRKEHIICLPNPLFHAYAIVICTIGSLHFGSAFVIPDEGYNPNKTLDAIKEEKCTILHGTPTMHVDLIDVQSRRNENIDLDIAVSGGAVCSPQLFKNMINTLKVKKVRSVYGLTEATAVVFHNLPDDDEYHSTTTVGFIGDHIEAKVIGTDGRMVPFGQPGELCLRGYLTMLGYWDDEEKTKEIMARDKWLKTGDQFILEKDGYGKVVGRIKEVIIRGGENIFPKEIEDFLHTHPDILESQVIGIPHERLGEEVCLFVRLKEGKTFDKDKLKAFCKGKIAHFKIPSRLVIIDEFPKTVTGKIQKFRLKEIIKDCL